ncbi:MAG TPA: penicillin-binding protein 2 [Bacillota bacterium]|nr:penicillin-binding protein 2 [Bacillota bacterium]HOL15516.1 penicillin-binding protein 2 [Bacillota bacterium]
MNKPMLRRVRIILIIAIITFIIFAGRLAYLQVVKHDYYWYRAEKNRYTKITLPATRGEIYDSEGRLLVSNRPGFVVSLMDMGEGYDPETVSYLSEILQIDREEIEEAIEGRLYMRYLPLRLKSDITNETIARISEYRWKLKGVNIDIRPIREYRAGSSAAHVLGFLGEGPVDEATRKRWAEEGYQYNEGDLVGQEGVERTWEPFLRGVDGEQLIEINNMGQPINYLECKEPVPGYDLYLTIDLDLQKAAEESLARRVEYIINKEGNKYAGRASAVILDPNSGAILAMANYPSYDLNTFHEKYQELSEDPRRPLVNSAIQASYPIGSTFKMVTATAALEKGVMSDRDIIRCPGVVRLYGDTKTCYRSTAHGSLNFYRALAVSCNIYFYHAGLRAGIDAVAHYAREYGFGSSTGITDLTGESPGVVASREYKAEVTGGEQWYPAETMSAAIGQSYNSITPLQMANYAAMIANGGTHYRPYLVQKAVDSKGQVAYAAEPEPLRQAQISAKTLGIIREGMRAVTRPRGTAYAYFSRLPVTSAGKTGSAEVHGNLPAHSLFVGYAPYENPQIAMAVIVEHGGIGATGAVPIAAEIMEYYFTGKIEGVNETDDQPPAD